MEISIPVFNLLLTHSLEIKFLQYSRILSFIHRLSAKFKRRVHGEMSTLLFSNSKAPKGIDIICTSRVS